MVNTKYEEPVIDLDGDSGPVITERSADKNEMFFFHFRRYDILLRYIDMYASATRSGKFQFILDWYSNLYQLYINLKQAMIETDLERDTSAIENCFNTAIEKYNISVNCSNNNEGNFNRNKLLRECINDLNNINCMVVSAIQKMKLGIKINIEQEDYE